jgi:hypothetical protein
VKRYAPVFRFHPDERFLPSSIEYLIEGATLNYRNFLSPTEIAGQYASSPALAYFKGWLYLVYKSSKTGELRVSRSRNGWEWVIVLVPTAVKPSSGVAAAVLKNQLCVVYSDSVSSQLWIMRSNNGLEYSPAQQIQNQWTKVPRLVAFEDNLFMVYRDSRGSQLWMSQSTDGTTWNTRQIENQRASTLALTVFKDNVVLVYTGTGRGAPSLWLSQYTPANEWNAPTPLPQQQGASVPALAVVGEWLCLIYSQVRASEFVATRSQDGVTWHDTRRIPGTKGSNLALSVLPDTNTLVCVYPDGETNELWSTRCLNGDFSEHTPIANLTQAILQQNSVENFWIEVNPTQYTGQALPTAPLYYAVQEDDEIAEIHYLILYPYQGGQTVSALRAGTEFNCVIPDLGTHQGDLERFAITLSKGKDKTYTILRVTFEAHGQVVVYTPNQVLWEDETHAVTYANLNSHGLSNLAAPGVLAHRSDVRVAGFVDVGDWTGEGAWWRPHSDGSDFRQLGLDKTGNPIGDQIWAAYGGRLGHTQENDLQSGTYFSGPKNGEKLDFLDWVFVKIVFEAAKLIKKLPADKLLGEGPIGPAARPWISQADGKVVEN